MRPLNLSSAQRGALRAALGGSIAAIGSAAYFERKDNPPQGFAGATIDVLLRLGLLKESHFEVFEYLATKRGATVAKRFGITAKLKISAPKTLRQRAMRLRELTQPDTWACGEKDAHQPKLLHAYVGHDNRWVEALGYGRFVVPSVRTGVRHLVLSKKGAALVSATDAPVTLRISGEMARNLEAGKLRQVIVPDPQGHHARLANFQILVTDQMQSPTDLWARLYDPAAIYPGTRITLVHAKTGKRLATARAGSWDRICFRSNEPQGGAIFDVIYEYSAASALDQYDRRIWVSSPYSTDWLAPCAESHRFAHDCGFDTINTMRGFWLRRSPKRREGGKNDVKGLLVQLTDLQIAKTPSREPKGDLRLVRNHDVRIEVAPSARAPVAMAA